MRGEHMRPIIALFPLLAACVSPGDEATRIGRECEAPIVEAYPDITERIAWRGGNPTVAQMANANPPTADEVARLLSFQPSASECRRRMATPIGRANPEFGRAWQTLSLSVDRVILGLVQRRITWGDANQQLAAQGERFRAEISSVREREAAREASRPRPVFIPMPQPVQPIIVAPVVMPPLPAFTAMPPPARFQTTCHTFGGVTNCH